MGAIQTYTKKMFDPLNPDARLVDILDIAHALSLMCRSNGHYKCFHSVAQHSLNCMQEAKARGCSARIQLACLLHDASEAYIADITRPVKAELPRYKQIEAPLQETIWNKWLTRPLDEGERELVFEIDDAILAHEFLALMETKYVNPTPVLASNPSFAFEGFEKSQTEFLNHFHRLTRPEKLGYVVGIDWMKPYWLAAELREGKLSVKKLSHISEINRYYLETDAVLIDIPIGLPESAEEAVLRPDRAARAFLSTERKSSVFSTPCRQAIGVEQYALASAENVRILGRKLTSQSYAFSKNIRQVDMFLEENPQWCNKLWESHPEVAFQILNGGKGLTYSKHTEEGIRQRIAILRSCGADPVPLFAGFTAKQYEDVLDAVCLAVSAKTGWENRFWSIPENPGFDRRGLKMQMVFGVL